MTAKLNRDDCTLYSGAAQGAEAEFGAAAERYGIDEVNFTFEGHTDARTRGIRVLTHGELKRGDVSLAYVSRLMHREFRDTPLFRKVLHGLSCRRYAACAEAVPEAFGLSASSVSRRFIRASAGALQELMSAVIQ